MARKLGIDLLQIHGSGPAGRILIDDLAQTSFPPAQRCGAILPSADFGKPGTRIKFTGLRRKIAEHMVHSKHAIPHFTYVDECDVSDLVKLRDALKDSSAARGPSSPTLLFSSKRWSRP